MNETTFSRQVRKSLEAKFGDKCYLKKIVGNGMMGEGTLDMMGSINGKFVTIESKLIRKLPKRDDTEIGIKFTPNQILNAKQAAVSGGAACGLVYLLEHKAAIIVPWTQMEEANTFTLNYIKEAYLSDVNSVKELCSNFLIYREPHDMWDIKNLIAYLEVEN